MTPALRLALFLVLAVAAYFGTATVARDSLSFSVVFTVLLVGVTILCARIGREDLAKLGFEVSKRRLLELGFGFGVGAGLFAAIALLSGLTPSASRSDAVSAVFLVPCFFLAEELLFRGYAFQQIAKLSSPWVAVGVTAAAFGAYHVHGAGVFLMPALAGGVFGYALVRTGSLALPIGLHWGGNWVQVLSTEPLPRIPYVLALLVMALAVWLITRDDRGR